MNTKHTSGPSLAQMRCRSTSGHRIVLESARDGVPLRTTRASEARGLMQCRATLIGWGCLEDNALTDAGRALLSAIAKATGIAS